MQDLFGSREKEGKRHDQLKKRRRRRNASYLVGVLKEKKKKNGKVTFS